MKLWRCRSVSGLRLVLAVLSLLAPVSLSATQFPCVTCHADKVLDKLDRQVHMAELADDCLSCHQPVEGKRHPREKGAIALPPRKSGPLCNRCHPREAARVVHQPVKEGECSACHVPHRAPAAGLTKMEGASLCVSCHTDMKFSRAFVHGPASGGNCLFCHDPHRSGNRKLLRKFGAALCFECHDTALDSGVSVHDPVGYGECTSCHDIHGSNQRMILKGNLTAEYYLPYERSNFALCFLCHPPELAESPSTEATQFRNGNQNLHFLHVNKSERGRSCLLCHDPHSASQQKLIMEQVPDFGNWKIPMYFTKTGTGGTCVVGCHKPKTYDRTEPVTY